MKRIILLIALVFITTIKAEATPEIYTSQPIRDIQASAYVHEISSTQQPLEVAQNNSQNTNVLNEPINPPIDRSNIQPQQDIDDGIRQYTIDEIKPRIDVLLQDPNHDFSTNDPSNNGLSLYLSLNYPKYQEYKQHIDSGVGRKKPTNKAIRALLQGDDSEIDREIEVDRQYAEINKRLANNVFATYNPYKSPTIPERDNTYRSLVYDNVKDIPIIGQLESFTRHALLGAVRYGIFGTGNLVISAIDSGINDKNFIDTLDSRGNRIDQGFNNAVGIGSGGNLSFRSEIDRAESNQRLLSYQGRNDDPDGANTYNYIKRILRSGDLQGHLNTIVGSIGEVLGGLILLVLIVTLLIKN